MRELRRHRADETIAGAGGIDGLDGASGNGQRFAVDDRKYTAFVQGHADDLVLADFPLDGLQRLQSDLLGVLDARAERPGVVVLARSDGATVLAQSAPVVVRSAR